MFYTGFFVTSTGTDIGKTFVTRGLSRSFSKNGFFVSAIKPIETGCDPDPLDAISLARSCGRPDLAFSHGLFRAKLPLSPYSVSLLSNSSAPDIYYLSSRISYLCLNSDITFIESAGGLLSPIDMRRTMADFAQLLGLPLLIVVRDTLGVISHTLTLFESVSLRNLSVIAVVMVRHEPGKPYLGPGSNFAILSELTNCPVFSFPFCKDDDESLAFTAESSGLLEFLSAC